MSENACTSIDLPFAGTISVAIVTYGRDKVLIDSIQMLLNLDDGPWELLIVDQTPKHDAATEKQLFLWHEQGKLRWIRQSPPSIPTAMNRAIIEARGSHVLFLDDDIAPDPNLIRAYQDSISESGDCLIAGRVLQPWNHGIADPETAPFRFNTTSPRPIREFMGGNVCIPRAKAITIGGFDSNFVRVSYRFEAEFSHRWGRAGYPFKYEPKALIHHLKVERGGTRSFGKHLTTIRPDHSVGRYYYLLRTRPLPAALVASLADLLRSVRSRHHLRHPWWIPLTLFAELRGLVWALRLQLRGPRLMPRQRPRLLIATSHPIQYQAPLFRALANCSEIELEVLFLLLPDAKQQGEGFGVAFEWDVPLLEGYRWRCARSSVGKGLGGGFRGIRLRHPGREIEAGTNRPDAILVTGWQVQGLLQILLAAWLKRLPILLRVEAGGPLPRPLASRLLHHALLAMSSVYLAIGKQNRRFYDFYGVSKDRIFQSPYFVDNSFFAEHSQSESSRREALRQQWGVPNDAFCFLFAGKLQNKKHPLDLLAALEQLQADPNRPDLHVLIVGSGELESACRERVQQRDLPVSFAGFLNQGEMAAAYAVTDALVLPSDRGETWGLVVNEAMACGLPAIVSDQVGCAEDLVEPGITGMIYPCRDVAALARGLAAMAGDPAAARRMGNAARERVLSSYGVTQARDGVLEGLRRALMDS
ncbi:MAG: glycosyltransferase [Synechococcaceae cyanobacterium]|nr:glycosyltransferase [Synechococcaceae cyanobacterium]